MSHEAPPLVSARPEDESRGARVARAWCDLDQGSAFLASDRDAIDATRSLRALVVDLLLTDRDAPSRDLLHALGALGRIAAERGASPTFVASTLDRLHAALDAVTSPPESHERADFDFDSFALSGRAALVESYVLAKSTAIVDEAMRAWEYPRCVVPLRSGVVAIAAGHPVLDVEALTGWAARVAHALAISGVRRAIVTGSDEAVATLVEALEMAGIERLQDDGRVDGNATRTTR